MSRLETQILRVLRSPKFFVAILVLFVLQALWIALSAAYPMVFDENTHFGIIQLHAQQLSPVFTQQPPNSGFAGALTRDPSYLFHYFLSFPYRLIANLTDSLMAQVIFLRLFNIAFFATGLVLFRKLLLRTKVSPALIHVTLLFLILTPVVPLLAGQINYDNLLFPVAAGMLLLAISITNTLRVKHKFPISKILVFLTVGMLGCLVQFAYLPVFAGGFTWLVWELFFALRSKKLKPMRDIKLYFSVTSWPKILLVSIPFLVAFSLFFHMYGINVLRYHHLTPRCDQVLTKAECSLNGGWQRNYTAYLNNDGVDANPALYAASWSYRMLVATFYTSSGGASPTAWYLSVNPLPVIFYTALVVLLGGIVLIVRYNRALFRGHPYLGGLVFVSLFYCLALWLINYQDFVRLGEKVAINGRYLFPVILPLMLLVGVAYNKLLSGRVAFKIGLFGIVLVLFLQGGGALSYITSSNPGWYWPNSTIIDANEGAQTIIKPLIFVETPITPINSVGNLKD